MDGKDCIGGRLDRMRLVLLGIPKGIDCGERSVISKQTTAVGNCCDPVSAIAGDQCGDNRGS